VLASSIIFVEFAPDGKKLFVLTANQSAYLFGLAAAAGGVTALLP
jgi:hypothetical protein